MRARRAMRGRLVCLAVTVISGAHPLSIQADTWRGTAPFCEGHCLSGETQVGTSDSGDGGYCVTGHKALCRNAQPTCLPRETQTSCYGVVKVCDNGFHESPTGNWHSCASYACGVCIGISSTSLTATSTGRGSGLCKMGYVWREAIANDHVCVPPPTRSQAAEDNRRAAERREPHGGSYGPDTCKAGFVWREVTPSDHICVLPAVRAAAAADNSAARDRLAGP